MKVVIEDYGVHSRVIDLEQLKASVSPDGRDGTFVASIDVSLIDRDVFVGAAPFSLVDSPLAKDDFVEIIDGESIIPGES